MHVLPTRLRTYRRYWAAFFLLLFLALLLVADARWMRGYETTLFAWLDPLTALAGLLTSGTVYKGLLLSLLVIVPTLFLGRFFCSWVCPLGIMNQILSRFFRHRRPLEEQEDNVYRPVFRVKYYLLAALLVLAAFGSLQTGLLDPIALTVRSLTVAVIPALDHLGAPIHLRAPVFWGGVLIALLFLAILAANRFMTRWWCRVALPARRPAGRAVAPGAAADLARRRPLHRLQHVSAPLPGGLRPPPRAARQRVPRLHELHRGLPRGRPALRPGAAPQLRPAAAGRQPPAAGRAVVASAVLFPMLRSSVSAANNPTAPVIRPPGSLAEDEFLGRCIKCAACMRVCPTNVLQPALLEAGLEGLWTPILVNRIGYCEHYCMLLRPGLPDRRDPALSPAEKTGSDRSPSRPASAPPSTTTAAASPGRCTSAASSARRCVPTSPKAIWYQRVQVAARDGRTIELKQPYVEPGLCIGCGICENKCPVEDLPAIRVSSVGETRSVDNQMLLKGTSG